MNALVIAAPDAFAVLWTPRFLPQAVRSNQNLLCNYNNSKLALICACADNPTCNSGLNREDRDVRSGFLRHVLPRDMGLCMAARYVDAAAPPGERQRELVSMGWRDACSTAT